MVGLTMKIHLKRGRIDKKDNLDKREVEKKIGLLKKVPNLNLFLFKLGINKSNIFLCNNILNTIYVAIRGQDFYNI